jgi:hypothetical protein
MDRGAFFIMAKKKKKSVKPARYHAKGFEAFKKLFFSDPTLSPTEVALRTYNCTTKGSASAIASQNLAKLKITHADLMARFGLSDEEDVRDLARLRKAKRLQSCDVYVKEEDGEFKINENSNDFIEVDDNKVQLDALKLSLQLKGALVDKVKHEGEIGLTLADVCKNVIKSRARK